MNTGYYNYSPFTRQSDIRNRRRSRYISDQDSVIWTISSATKIAVIAKY